MSGILHKDDKKYLLAAVPKKGLGELDRAILLTTFDADTDVDEKHIQAQQDEILFVKKLIIIKLVLYIPETVLSFLLLKKTYRANKRLLYSLYFQFLKNKININDFKKELHYLFSKGII